MKNSTRSIRLITRCYCVASTQTSSASQCTDPINPVTIGLMFTQLTIGANMNED
jgi:hypothetical protein